MTGTMFGIRPGARVEVIIDGVHLYSVCRNLGFEINYETLRRMLHAEYDCRRISYFMKVAYDDHGAIQQAPIAKLLDFLRYNGYSTVIGQAKEWTNHEGRRVIRQGVDVAVACAMLQAAHRVDEIIVFAGAEDLASAVEACVKDGARITLVSSVKTTPLMVSSELRSAVDWFVELLDIKDKIYRRDREIQVREPRDTSYATPPSPAVQEEAVILEDRRGDNSVRSRMRIHPRSNGSL